MTVSADQPEPTRAISGGRRGDRPRKIVVCHPDNYKAIQVAVTRDMRHTDVLVQMNRWIDPETTYVFDGDLLDMKRPIGPESLPTDGGARTVGVSDRTGQSDPDVP